MRLAPEQLAEALGAQATHRGLTSADAAGEHCHVAASDVLNRFVMDWLEEALSLGPPNTEVPDASSSTPRRKGPYFSPITG